MLADGQVHGEAGPDARAQEDRRRVHRTGAEHDLAALDRGPLAIELHAHADRSTPFQHHPIDEGVADDAKVRTAAGRLEVRVVRRDALFTHGVTIDRVRRNALARRRVVVRAPAVATRERRAAQRAVNGTPSLLRDPEDGHRPVDAVPRIATEVVLGLEPAIRGQHVIPPPARKAPLVVIFGHWPDREDAVDRRRATHSPPAPQELGLLQPCAPRLQCGVLQGLELVMPDDEAGVQRPHLGCCIGRPPVRTGLEQQHRPMRILTQPRREHASGGAATRR